MKNRNLDHSDNWRTPPTFYDKLNERFNFNFDPCPYLHDLDKWDGLKIDWKERNFINPPYSQSLKEGFVKKAIKEYKKGNMCVMLLPVSTSTYLFHDFILPQNPTIEFIKGRLPFIGINKKMEYINWKKFGYETPEGAICKNNQGQHDSMLVIFK